MGAPVVIVENALDASKPGLVREDVRSDSGGFGAGTADYSADFSELAGADSLVGVGLGAGAS